MITVGELMPEFTYRDRNGAERRLSEEWQAGPAWILWLRHCGCQFYREASGDLSTASAAFAASNLRRVCIVQGSSAEAEALCAADGACDTCIPDPERRSFALAGLRRANLAEVLFPSAELKARRAEAKAAGAKQDWKRTFTPGNDAMLLPGAALVDAGVVRHVHIGAHTGDLPKAAELLAIARVALATAS